VTKSAPVDSGYTVTGQVTVFNPNEVPATGVAVSDAIGTTTCSVSGGSTIVVAGGSEVFDYTCSLATGTAGTNTATVTWDKASVDSLDDSATATAGFDFLAAPTVVGNCTTVSDTLKGTLGTVCASTTFPYTLSVTVPASGCATYDNTASETTSGTSASASVQVCRTNSNGLTMGYWQNKNGQAQITGDASLCAYLALYPTVLTGLPSPCSSAKLAGKTGYVSSVINAANAAGDGAPMFKGQFLATALSAHFNSALASTGIAVSGAIFGSTCMTVSQLLTFGNVNYAALSANKTSFMAVKAVYDAINNNTAVTC
jgi:hypothetical protein